MSLASPDPDVPVVLFTGTVCAHCGREIQSIYLGDAQTPWIHLAGGRRECERTEKE